MVAGSDPLCCQQVDADRGGEQPEASGGLRCGDEAKQGRRRNYFSVTDRGQADHREVQGFSKVSAVGNAVRLDATCRFLGRGA